MKYKCNSEDIGAAAERVVINLNGKLKNINVVKNYEIFIGSVVTTAYSTNQNNLRTYHQL